MSSWSDQSLGFPSPSQQPSPNSSLQSQPRSGVSPRASIRTVHGDLSQSRQGAGPIEALRSVHSPGPTTNRKPACCWRAMSASPPIFERTGKVELMQFPLRPSPRESTGAIGSLNPYDGHLAGPPADRVGPQTALKRIAPGKPGGSGWENRAGAQKQKGRNWVRQAA
jgi:hypothetical protein